MEFKIVKNEKNPFLHRHEMILNIISNQNPSEKEIIEHLKKPEELVVINKISNHFGRSEFSVDIFVYDSKEHKAQVETIPKKIKKKMEEEAKKAQAAAAPAA